MPSGPGQSPADLALPPGLGGGSGPLYLPSLLSRLAESRKEQPSAIAKRNQPFKAAAAAAAAPSVLIHYLSLRRGRQRPPAGQPARPMEASGGGAGSEGGAWRSRGAWRSGRAGLTQAAASAGACLGECQLGLA